MFSLFCVSVYNTHVYMVVVRVYLSFWPLSNVSDSFGGIFDNFEDAELESSNFFFLKMSFILEKKQPIFVIQIKRQFLRRERFYTKN